MTRRSGRWPRRRWMPFGSERNASPGDVWHVWRRATRPRTFARCSVKGAGESPASTQRHSSSDRFAPVLLIPVKDQRNAKQRLAAVLSPEERFALAQAMLEDVLAV